MNEINQHSISDILRSVMDPEIPVLSITDLGIVRKIEAVEEDGKTVWEISITPTYSGCPAMDVIATQIRMMMYSNGITGFRIKQVLSPAWTTDWMTEEGKSRLSAYGIAPPVTRTASGERITVVCPNCGSADTEMLSEFGSTACKSLYRCRTCLEPFDYFKCH